MTDEQANYMAWVDMWISSSKNWWEKTGNPLCVWKALAFSLNAQPPRSIPDWCLSYLTEAAGNIDRLAAGRDFRGDRAPVSSDKAHALVAAALKLSSQGKKNAFARIMEMSADQQHALDSDYGHDAVDAIRRARNVTPEHARRRLREGKRLNRQG